MKATDIKGQPVRPEGSDEVTGTVSDLVLDLEERRILALHVWRMENDTVYLLDVADVVAVDAEAVTLRPDAVLLPVSLAERYDSMPTLGRMLEEKAMTEDGRILGKVTDIEFDPKTWNVTAYDIVTNYAQALSEGEQQIVPDQVLSAGAHTLLVAEPEASS